MSEMAPTPPLSLAPVYFLHGTYHCPQFFFLILTILGLHGCLGFSLVAARGRYSLVAAHRLLTAVTSLVRELGLLGVWASVVEAHRLSSCSSWALEHGLNSCGVWA